MLLMLTLCASYGRQCMAGSAPQCTTMSVMVWPGQLTRPCFDPGTLKPWNPKTLPVRQAFPGIINGGVIGALFDCHGNWTAAIALMDRAGLPRPPLTLTSELLVREGFLGFPGFGVGPRGAAAPAAHAHVRAPGVGFIEGFLGLQGLGS